jgi:hypothetical protein
VLPEHVPEGHAEQLDVDAAQLVHCVLPEHVPEGHAEQLDVDAAQLVHCVLPEHVPEGHAEQLDVDAAQLVHCAQPEAAQLVHVDVAVPAAHPEHVVLPAAHPEHPCGTAVVAVVVVDAVELDVCATALTAPKIENATIATTKTAVIFRIFVLRFFLGGASISGETSITNGILSISAPRFFLGGF